MLTNIRLSINFKKYGLGYSLFSVTAFKFLKHSIK